MITKLIDDSGVEEDEEEEEVDHNNNENFSDDEFKHEDTVDHVDDTAISDITKPDVATKAPIGNPLGPATVGLVLVVPENFDADIVKGLYSLSKIMFTHLFSRPNFLY